MSKSIYNTNYRQMIDALRSARKASHITQQYLADAMGKPQSYIAKIEGFERRADIIEFLEIAAFIRWDPFPILSNVYHQMKEH